MEEKLHREPSACAVIGCKKSKLWDLVKQGELAPPLKIGPRYSAWRHSDLMKFIAMHVARAEAEKTARQARGRKRKLSRAASKD